MAGQSFLEKVGAGEHEIPQGSEGYIGGFTWDVGVRPYLKGVMADDCWYSVFELGGDKALAQAVALAKQHNNSEQAKRLSEKGLNSNKAFRLRLSAENVLNREVDWKYGYRSWEFALWTDAFRDLIEPALVAHVDAPNNELFWARVEMRQDPYKLYNNRTAFETDVIKRLSQSDQEIADALAELYPTDATVDRVAAVRQSANSVQADVPVVVETYEDRDAALAAAEELGGAFENRAQGVPDVAAPEGWDSEENGEWKMYLDAIYSELNKAETEDEMKAAIARVKQDMGGLVPDEKIQEVAEHLEVIPW